MNFPNGTRASEHREICELIPWYVNGTIGAIDRQPLDTHVLTCTACRTEMLEERRIHEAISAGAGVECMPAASFKRLRARIEHGEGTLDSAPKAPASPFVRRTPARGVPRQAPRRHPIAISIAASSALLAVAISLVWADKAYRIRGWDLSPYYRTVTTPTPRAPNEVIRAVFLPTITLVELQAILHEAQLRIVSGPTEAEVYSLAANTNRPVNASLALLRRHSAVQFAESTQPGDTRGGGESP